VAPEWKVAISRDDLEVPEHRYRLGAVMRVSNQAL
jgi:hypothetical protein